VYNKMNKSKKINIYIDLDETLIYSIDIRRKKMIPSFIELYRHYNFDNEFIVLERPGLQYFLDWLFDHFNVSVWSAASPDYVDFIVRNIITQNNRKLKRVLNSDNCDKSMELYGENHLKKLEMLWDHYKLPDHGPDNTVLLDDLCLNMRSQPENCVRIKKFLGTADFITDRELDKVKGKLMDIMTHYAKKKKIDKSPIRKRKM